MLHYWCCIFIFSSLVLAQPPNNLCSTAVTISDLPFTYNGATTGASKEHICNNQYSAGDVWFSFLPTSSVYVHVDLCSANYDSVIYLVSGSCASYTCISSNDDGCASGYGSRLYFPLTAGTRYFIIVSGYGSRLGGSYTLAISSLGPATIGCLSAQVISSLPYIKSDAIDSGSIAFPCRGPSVYYADWYAFTPSFTASVTISLCNAANFDSYLIIATGSCDSTTCTGITNDNGCGEQSIITTTITANVRYYIIVTSFRPQITGTYTITVTAPPRNNLCSAASVIASLPYSVSGHTFGATQDFSCSSGSVTSGRPDVWYSLIPSSNIPAIVLSTCASASGQRIYLAGGACGSLQCIQSDSSSCPYGTSSSGWIQTSMQAGTTYYFAIGGNSPTAYRLDVFIPPVNDQCAGAIVIPSLPYTAPPASTTYARPDFLACISTAQRDIYYVFTPSTTYNSVTISLCGSSFDTFLSLASGSCAGLSCLDTNDDSDCGDASTLRDKTLVAGTTYYIIVAGYSSDHFGSVSLTITGIPLNSCATPRVIPSIPYSFASNTASTASSAITCRDGSTVAGVTGAIWFSFTPESTINHVYITSYTSFDSVLLFTSGSCNSLPCSAPVTGNSEFCLAQNSRGSQISDVTLLSGVRYLFVVTGSSAADYGAFTFSIGIDSSASLSISAPAANSIVGGTQLASLLISGLAGTLDAQGTVTFTISDSSTGTSDIVVSAVVGFDGRWSVPVNILSLADGNIVVDGRLVDPSQNTATTKL